MKKALMFLLSLVLALSASSCFLIQDKVLTSLGGYTSKEFYTHGEFQDYTDYGKYVYDDAKLENNPYFDKINDDSLEELIEHLDFFEEWVLSIKENTPQDELAMNYDFDRAVISEGDYLYISDDPDYPESLTYKIYFFDTDSMTLYYFHNNI